MKQFMILAVCGLIWMSGAFTAQEAHAGDVRLNMGGPLGTFTAKGKGNYVGNPRLKAKSKSRSSCGPSCQRAIAKKKAAARKAAARKAAAKQAAAKKAAAKKLAAKKAAAKRKAAAAAAARKSNSSSVAAQQREKAARIAAQRSGDDAKDGDDVATTDGAKASPVKASAIAGANQLLEEETDTSATDDNDTSADNADAGQAGTDEDTQPVDVAAAENGDTAAPEKETENVGEGGCKKYVPSAGLTISVPCEE